ncbi:MAG: large subunit ribosomal protein L21 [Lysobacterales bacterium]|jgi:large subunit ribosomal protein L21
MYVVFSTGGKQYRASTGDIVKVEKLEAEKGSTVELDSVLMIGEGEDVKVGTPYITGSKVTAVVVEHGRGEKIKIIKFKRRKHHMRKTGHRQYFTALQITGIDSTTSKPKAAKPAEAKPEVEAVEVKAAPAKKAASKKTASKKVTAKKAVAKKAPVKKAAAKKTASKKKTAKKVAAKAPAVEDKGDE